MSYKTMWDNIEEKREVFEAVAMQYMDALYNSALKLTYNEGDAKDLIQETYFKAFRFFEQFEPGTSCKAWLYKTLKNTFINKYRKKVKQPDHVNFDAIEPFLELIKKKDHFDSRALDEDIAENYLSDEINEALSKLSYDFRMVTILSDIEGFSYKEIADIMECPIGTM